MSAQQKALWVFIVAFSPTLYGNGAGFMESFVNYPSWHVVGEAEFMAFHQFITPKVVAFLVAPLAIALQAPVWIATVVIQAPIQLQLSDQGLSLPLIERLIETDFWWRRVPYAACAGLFIWMAARISRAALPRVA